MRVTDIEGLDAKTAKFLEARGWDVETLAGAKISDLTPVTGVGIKKARAIITNAQVLLASVKSVADTTKDDSPPMSARVKRIREGNL